MREEAIEGAVRGKNVLVTGGTGSFGHQIIRAMAKYRPARITVFSRDEKKQYDMQQEYRNTADLQFVLGDVRDFERVREATRGMDVVYHAAALKQVPNCEWSPYEAVATNINGAENIRRAAIENGVGVVVGISTDKAVKPVNVMGMSKALQERILLHPSNSDTGTRFVCVRYGNVLGSRGSVVPLFCEYIARGEPIPITHPDMTRFQLTLSEAVQLVFWATVEGQSGDLWVRKMPALRIMDLGRLLAYGLTGNASYPFHHVGTRPGEKMHEVLVSEEEMWRATELEEHYLIPNWARSQDKPGQKEGPIGEYASNGTWQLTDEQVLKMLESDGWIEGIGKPGPKSR
jgi:UDP-glucose 4-epimerase